MNPLDAFVLFALTVLGFPLGFALAAWVFR